MKASELREIIDNRILVVDGGMGTELIKRGADAPSAVLVDDNPGPVMDVHKSYAKAGADVIITANFIANRSHLGHYNKGDRVTEINRKSVQLIRESCPDAIIAGEFGPIAEYIEPIGKATFDGAYEMLSEVAKGLSKADIIFVSTMADVKMAKAAFLAARDNLDLPIFVHMTYEGGRTPTGTDPLTAAAIFQSLGAFGLGANCGAGPDEMLDIVEILAGATSLPLCFQPNAGVPKIVDGKSVVDTSPETMAEYALKYAKLGVNIIGSCCSSGPLHTKAIAKAVKGIPPKSRRDVTHKPRLTGRTVTVEIDRPIIVGERINPTSRKGLTAQIKAGDTSGVVKEALQQISAGAQVLDINVGVAGIDEKKALLAAVDAISSVADAPLSLDTKDAKALEACLKSAPGKCLINSVTGEEKSLETILPLAKRYGAAIIGLAVGDNGVGKTAEQKIEIAKKIIERAKAKGIQKEDIIIDLVTLSIATGKENADETLRALREIKKMGFLTILGVSNISHGLPNRSEVNSQFLHQALEAGLDLAIMNPLDEKMIAAFKGEITAKGGFSEYLQVKIDYTEPDTLDGKLRNAILYGQEDKILPLVEEAVKTRDAAGINSILIGALEELGDKFERKEIFLPQLLLSAETMKKAFGRLKGELKGGAPASKGKAVMATVKGDMHDIGKNIVSTLLEAHGIVVVDAGVDRPPEKLLGVIKEEKPDAVGLSALMTTTALEMKNTIKFLRDNGIDTPILVGGAVIDAEFAKEIGGVYCADGMAAIRTMEKLLNGKPLNGEAAK